MVIVRAFIFGTAMKGEKGRSKLNAVYISSVITIRSCFSAISAIFFFDRLIIQHHAFSYARHRVFDHLIKVVDILNTLDSVLDLPELHHGKIQPLCPFCVLEPRQIVELQRRRDIVVGLSGEPQICVAGKLLKDLKDRQFSICCIDFFFLPVAGHYDSYFSRFHNSILLKIVLFFHQVLYKIHNHLRH